MTNSQANPTTNLSFNISDYVEITSEAAKRTRTVTIILVVASVLVFIGFYNSFYWSWPLTRITSVYDPQSASVYLALNADKHPKMWPNSSQFTVGDFIDPIGLANKLVDQEELLSEYLYNQMTSHTQQSLAECVKTNKLTLEFLSNLAANFNEIIEKQSLFDEKRFEKINLPEEIKERLNAQKNKGNEIARLNRLLLETAYSKEIAKSKDTKPIVDFRKDLQESVVKAYVENIRFVRVPFFGIAFDVNDLGLIGGIGLIAILAMLVFSLSREIKNLNFSFEEAVNHGQLPAFYHMLAMRQVFTVPHMRDKERNRLLAIAPKFVCILPAIVFSIGVIYDYYSIFFFGLFDLSVVSKTLIFETIWLLFIWPLSYRCWKGQSKIDRIWDTYWNRIKGKKYSVIHLDAELVEKFGSDPAVNSALRSLQVNSSNKATSEPQRGSLKGTNRDQRKSNRSKRR